MKALVTRETCGRCGANRKHHPRDRCEGFRPSWWWDRHFFWQHVAAWLWVHATPRKVRWAVADWYHKRGACWCNLYDCVSHANEWNDQDQGFYRSRGHRYDYTSPYCLCEFPLPWKVGPPTGNCYCPPADALSGDA